MREARAGFVKGFVDGWGDHWQKIPKTALEKPEIEGLLESKDREG
jgi:hypothetical protein